MKPGPKGRNFFTWEVLGLVLTLVALGWLYGNTISPRITGFMHDDGVYAILGKSLAEGAGYVLPHHPGTPAEVKYPFFYPLILAAGWLINPAFPDNLSLLTWITTGFAIAGFGVVFLYLKRFKHLPGWLALLIVWMTACNYYLIMFSTTLMAEGPYLFFSFLTLFVAEGYFRQSGEEDTAGHSGPQNQSRIAWPGFLGLLVLSAITFHTRIMGLTLIAAIFLWFLIQRRYREGLLYGALVAGLTVIPWWLWLQINADQFRLMPYQNYGSEFMSIVGAGLYDSRLPATFSALIYRLLEAMFNGVVNFFIMVSRWWPHLDENRTAVAIHLLVVLLGSYAIFGYYVVRLIQTVGSGIRNKTLSVLSLSGLYVVLYFLLSVVWGYEEQMARFSVVVLPLLWFYLLQPLFQNLRQGVRPRLQMGAILLLAALSLMAAPKTFYTIAHIRAHDWIDMGDTPGFWQDYEVTFREIETHVPADARMATYSDVVFYLYTGRPTYYLSINVFETQNELETLKKQGVRYLIMEPYTQGRVILGPENPVARGLIDKNPESFVLRYASPRRLIKIYEIL